MSTGTRMPMPLYGRHQVPSVVPRQNNRLRHGGEWRNARLDRSDGGLFLCLILRLTSSHLAPVLAQDLFTGFSCYLSSTVCFLLVRAFGFSLQDALRVNFM